MEWLTFFKKLFNLAPVGQQAKMVAQEWQRNSQASNQRKIGLGQRSIWGQLLNQSHKNRLLVEGTNRIGLPEFRNQSEAQGFLTKYQAAGGDLTTLYPNSWQKPQVTSSLGGQQLRNLMEKGNPATIQNIITTTANVGGETIINQSPNASQSVIQSMLEIAPELIEQMFWNAYDQQRLAGFLRQLIGWFAAAEVLKWDSQAFNQETTAFQLITRYLTPDQIGSQLCQQSFFLQATSEAMRQAVSSIQGFLNPNTQARIREMQKLYHI